MNFGENLQRLRTERGIYPKQLASALHISVATLSNIEKGILSPQPEILCRIADYFQVTTDYLLGRSQSPSSQQDIERE
ncbi:MAG: helix-turn-helix domain-containing protein [bacterium]|nr:helix-turn-helix domain-containing protein [bacterium]